MDNGVIFFTISLTYDLMIGIFKKYEYQKLINESLILRRLLNFTCQKEKQRKETYNSLQVNQWSSDGKNRRNFVAASRVQPISIN